MTMVDRDVNTSDSERQALGGLSPVRTLWRDPVARWVVAITVILLIVLVIMPSLATTSPTAMNAGPSLASPSAEHLFGTDQLGRDIAIRALHGARLSMLIAVTAALTSLILGGLLGSMAAVGPRWVGETIMRIVDIGLAFPGILLALVLAAAMGPSLVTTIIVLGVLFTFPMSRVVRSAVLAEYGEDYVTAARLQGTGRIRLVGYHISVNALPPVLVYTTVQMSMAVLAEAGLSFLGAGVPPPAPSWGSILADGQRLVFGGVWWVSLFPGVAIMLTVWVLNRFSEALGRRMRA